MLTKQKASRHTLEGYTVQWESFVEFCYFRYGEPQTKLTKRKS